MKKLITIITLTMFILTISVNNRIKSIAENNKIFASANNLSTNYCLVVNYAIPSGYCRVFLYDYNTGHILYKAHTMHGSGGGSTESTPVFSNRAGSKCSTLGRFAITKTHGTINPNGFRLRGLDNDNKNAWDRALMLHSAWLVDDALRSRPKYLPIDEVWCAGCITMSTPELEYISKYIYKESKQMLVISIK